MRKWCRHADTRKRKEARQTAYSTYREEQVKKKQVELEKNISRSHSIDPLRQFSIKKVFPYSHVVCTCFQEIGFTSVQWRSLINWRWKCRHRPMRLVRTPSRLQGGIFEGSTILLEACFCPSSRQKNVNAQGDFFYVKTNNGHLN